MTVHKPQAFLQDFGQFLREHPAAGKPGMDLGDRPAQAFARYLKAIRQQQNLSITDLATQSGIPEAEIVALEHQLIFSPQIKSETLYALAMALNRHIAEFALILGREIPRPHMPGTPQRLSNSQKAFMAYWGSPLRTSLALLLIMTVSVIALVSLLASLHQPDNSLSYVIQQGSPRLADAIHYMSQTASVATQLQISKWIVTVILFLQLIWFVVWRGELILSFFIRMRGKPRGKSSASANIPEHRTKQPTAQTRFTTSSGDATAYQWANRILLECGAISYPMASIFSPNQRLGNSSERFSYSQSTKALSLLLIVNCLTLGFALPPAIPLSSSGPIPPPVPQAEVEGASSDPFTYSDLNNSLSVVMLKSRGWSIPKNSSTEFKVRDRRSTSLPRAALDFFRGTGWSPQSVSSNEAQLIWGSNHTAINNVQGTCLLEVPGLYLAGINNFDLDFHLTYNSANLREGLFGVGWSSFLDLQLVDNPLLDGIVVSYPNGTQAYFVREDDGRYTPTSKEVSATLLRDSRSFTLSTPEAIYRFDTQRRLISFSDHFNNTITLRRGTTGQITLITDSTGRTVALTYRGAHPTSITDPLKRVWRYVYDSAGDLTQVVDANGGVYRFEYDQHRLIRRTNPNGNRYQHRYDEVGRLVEEVNALGFQSRYTYKEGETLFTDANDHTVRYVYDEDNHLLTIYDARGGREHFGYDSQGRLTQYTNQLGHTWTYTYDRRGHLISIRDPNDGSVTYRYDQQGYLASVTDANDYTTTFTYNAANQVTSITGTENDTVTYTYDNQGQLVAITDANGHTAHFGYDQMGNLVSYTDQGGDQSLYHYDQLGRLIGVDSGNDLTRYEYDALDRVISAKVGDQITTYQYDASDNLIKATGPQRTIEYTYDPVNRLIGVEAGNQVTRYSYDPMGNVILRSNAEGTIGYTYDALQRLTRIENNTGWRQEYTYDPVNNRTSLTTYDEPNGIDRLLRRPAHPTVITYQYDNLNRLVQMQDAQNGVTTFEYDQSDRQIQVGNATRGISIFYDPLGRMSLSTHAQGFTTTYIYDQVGQVVSTTSARRQQMVFFALILVLSLAGLISILVMNACQEGWRIWAFRPVSSSGAGRLPS